VNAPPSNPEERGAFVVPECHHQPMCQHYTVSDGRVVPPGTLVRMGEGRWEEPRPGALPERTHQCDCDAKPIFTPPLDEPECHCQVRKQPPPVSR
jgi:hypothetical protein